MKIEQIREFTDQDLVEHLENSKKELLNLRFQVETRKIKNHQRIPEVKRDVARLMTVIRERELMALYAGEDYVPLRRETVVREESPRRRGLFGRNR